MSLDAATDDNTSSKAELYSGSIAPLPSQIWYKTEESTSNPSSMTEDSGNYYTHSVTQESVSQDAYSDADYSGKIGFYELDQHYIY